MTNLDLIKESRQKFAQKMMDAVKNDKPEDFSQALTDFAVELSESIVQQAQELVNVNDSAILAQRGVRQLTSEETKYYQAAITAMKSKNPKQALSELDVVLPQTTIDAVFENITTEHPLLNMINFQNTGALTEIITSTTSGVADWGELCSEINDELSAEFKVMTLGMYKLSAFVPVCKAMLDLGPAWLDSYVRIMLSEALATALEAAVVDGDGKEKPVGMTRALTGAVDGVYPHKTTVSVTSLDSKTIGSILDTVSKAPNNKRRAVPRLLMVVNPADYYTKVFAATTVRTVNGSYTNDVLPYPMDIVISPAVTAGKAVFGLANKYFGALGTSKGGKLEYSDEYKFLEDIRIYLIKLYGNGRALDENAFVYADISELKPELLRVETVPVV